MGAPASPQQEDLKKPSPTEGSSNSCATYLSLIQQYLQVFQTENALWLAERCVAQYPNSQEAVYLQAVCYYRLNTPHNARAVLDRQSSLTAAMQYLSAKCSFDLRDYTRAENALLKEARAQFKQAQRDTPMMSGMDEWILQTTPCPIPNGAAGLALLGKISRKSNRRERAIKYLKMSLRLDPFLFTSFQELAELGCDDMDPSAIFGGARVEPVSSTEPQVTFKTPLQTMTPAAVTTAGTRHNPLMNLRSSFETPGLTPIAVNASTAPAQTPLPPPPPTASSENNPVVTQRARQVASRQYYQPSPETPMHSVTRSMRYLRGLGAEDSVTASKSGTGARSLFLTSENQSSNQGPAVDATEEGDDNLKPASKEPDHAVQDILDLMSVCGAAVQSLSQYRCREALLYMMHLPIVQQATPWVLHIQGRAFLEKGDFTSAEKCLEHMHRIDPGRMQGLELLSTVYWQLKKEVELANLAQHATDWDYQSPEAHCVAGNCFSLQKDHETALVFFKRSLQLNADFTYTHTLAGYEYIANEDFDRAAKSFRQALRTDERHYNAWYGLGVLYHRQEKFDLAEYHFARAVQIHPNSSVLRCNLGMAQVANGKAYEALETLSEAFRLDPRNPQARFQRATIYSTLNRPEEALQELKTVRDAAPREATVHFAMGKILKRLGRPDEAMKCFLTAMDLDPKDNQMIKSAMDKLDEQDVDEESTAAF